MPIEQEFGAHQPDRVAGVELQEIGPAFQALIGAEHGPVADDPEDRRAVLENPHDLDLVAHNHNGAFWNLPSQLLGLILSHGNPNALKAQLQRHRAG